MQHRRNVYIDGAWQEPAVSNMHPIVNPATEEVMYEIALGSAADVDRAVIATHTAFDLDADEVEAVVYGGTGR